MHKTGVHYNCTVSSVFDLKCKITATVHTAKYF